MTHPNDADEDEGTAVDVHVDLPSVITVSVETTAPKGVLHDAYVDMPSVITASVETAARRLPADDEPATCPHDLRAPATLRSETSARVPAGSGVDEDKIHCLLITPRFYSEGMASSERAFATDPMPNIARRWTTRTRVCSVSPAGSVDEEGDATLLRGANPNDGRRTKKDARPTRGALRDRDGPSIQTASPGTPR